MDDFDLMDLTDLLKEIAEMLTRIEDKTDRLLKDINQLKTTIEETNENKCSCKCSN